MASNIEIKARVRDFPRLKQLAENISDVPCESFEQEDTFFRCPTGRLKLRVLTPDCGYLIYYKRDDEEGPKQSDYILSQTREPMSLLAALSSALGVHGVVRKRRFLCRVGQTRIHLDEVEGLGQFVELEYVMHARQNLSEGLKAIEKIIKQLDIHDEDLIAGAYIDLLMGASSDLGRTESSGSRADSPRENN